MRIAGPPTSISGRQCRKARRQWESERRQCRKASVRSAKRGAHGHRRGADGLCRGANGVCQASNEFRRGSDGRHLGEAVGLCLRRRGLHSLELRAGGVLSLGPPASRRHTQEALRYTEIRGSRPGARRSCSGVCLSDPGACPSRPGVRLGLSGAYPNRPGCRPRRSGSCPAQREDDDDRPALCPRSAPSTLRECFLCQDVCHVLREHHLHEEFIGPRLLVYAAALEMHPLDGEDRVADAGMPAPGT
jgi:hypothetical protein